MTREEQAAAQARCDAATEGPWEEGCGSDGKPISCARSDCIVDNPETRQGKLNLSFIDHARTDLPAALAEIRRLEVRVQHLEGVLASVEFGCEPGNCPECGGNRQHIEPCSVGAALRGVKP